MKNLALCTICIFLFALTAHAQTDCPHPNGCVTISREAALKALADDSTVKAQVIELAANAQAIIDLKELLNGMRIQFAEKSGENIALKQNAVADRAIITAIIPLMRKKCMPLSICF